MAGKGTYFAMGCVVLSLGFTLPEITQASKFPELGEARKPAQAMRTSKHQASSGKVSRQDSIRVADWIYLPAPDWREIKHKNQEKGGFQIGVRRPLPAPIRLSGYPESQWQISADGNRVFTIALQSGGAEALRIQVVSATLPSGVYLQAVNALNPGEVVGPYFARDLDKNSMLWTESLFSEVVYLQCVVPSGVPLDTVQFSLGDIGHVYEPVETWAVAKLGPCHNDVNCADSAWRSTAAGVAGIGSITASSLIWCTGILMNNNLNNFVDYFLTAQHCISSQTQADATEFYWFYTTTACGGSVPNLASVPRTGGGAVLLAARSRSAGSDFALLRLRQNSPGGVTYAGWNSSPPGIGNPVRSIHHPDNSFKRISYGAINSLAGSFWRVIWNSGSTEAGGSGAPLLNASRQVIGQLWGGTASCNNMNGYDEFGRFDLSFPLVQRWIAPSAPIVNDHFANATPINGTFGQALGRNDIATREPAEPNHDDQTGFNSVWWRWTAPSNGLVTFTTFGSTFDTLLAVYTGVSLTQLTRIVSGDDDIPNKQSRVAFFAQSGVEYMIAVDGYQGAWGNIALNWMMHDPGQSVTKSVYNDYSGNGRSDLVAYDNQLGRWYTRSINGPIISWAEQWGYSVTVPVPGDYNGDGRWDLSVFEIPTGNWYMKNVHGNAISVNNQWGWSTARLVPGDYNGDGRWDQAVFDAVGAYWYIKNVSGPVITWKNQWGWSGAKPVPGDYNGNGSHDLAVFDTIGGFWYAKTVQNQVILWRRQWGWSGAITVPGDYNGDGRSDLAVFNATDGTWYILGASGNLIGWKIQWGWNGALPVAGDYNGDGRADLAVLDRQTARWYVRTVNGQVIAWAQQWGWNGATTPRIGD